MKKLFKLILFIVWCSLGYTAQAEETDLYDFLWLDPDKKVYVLQNKVHKKKGHAYTDVAYLKGLSAEFQSTKGVAIRAGYYFHEEWAFELVANFYSNSDNTTYENLVRINGAIPFLRKFEKSYGPFVIWSPFYGKINTFNKIFYFDWYFGAGLMQLKAQSNADSATIPTDDSFKKETFTALGLKTGMKFHITERWHVGLEYMNTSYKGEGPIKSEGTKIRSNGDLLLSVGFTF